MFQIRLNCMRQNSRTPLPSHPSLHFHLDFYPHSSLSFLSPFIIWRGRESPPGHFYNPATPPPPPQISTPPPLPNSSFAHQVQREPLKQHLAPTHPHTHAHGVPSHPRLFHAHTLSFSVPYTSNTWKDALRGPRLKGELEVGVREGGGGETGWGYKSSAWEGDV